MRNKGKKIFSIIAIISFFCATVMTGCSEVQDADVTTSVTEITEITTEAVTEEYTEATTAKKESVLIKTEPMTSEYVYNAQEKYYEYSGSFTITGESGYEDDLALSRLPQLNIDSDDARKINEELLEKYSDFFERDSHDLGRVDYVVYQHGDVLMLVVEEKFEGVKYFTINAYSINVVTGKALDKEDVVNMCGISLYDAYESIRAYANDDYDRWKEEFPEFAQDSVEELAEVRRLTTSDENVSKAQFYVDAQGELMCAFSKYWFIGNGLHTTVIPLNASIQ